MMSAPVSRRSIIRSSAAAASWLAASPAIIGRAQAATLKLKCSSSLPNDPKFANGRVYYDNLVKSLKAFGVRVTREDLLGQSPREGEGSGD